MKEQVSNRCKILITKKITDSLSVKEQTELNKYLTSNGSAKQYFEELKRIWDLTNTLVPSSIFKTDVSEEWVKFIQSLKPNKSQ
ncbi:hypothetical protein [Marinilabilia rubra]|uniref:Uncharacterized protein n=1 Tax=Marinilabilia rubra TaxID=2162893 RepID=A0A2U2B3G5_9BACT|nr:hypothetical protein [Marinilabilia rubra]PWD97605.1 hypothetical protein DDZ16_19895 [Marinilabilia rubra]